MVFRKLGEYFSDKKKVYLYMHPSGRKFVILDADEYLRLSGAGTETLMPVEVNLEELSGILGFVEKGSRVDGEAPDAPTMPVPSESIRIRLGDGADTTSGRVILQQSGIQHVPKNSLGEEDQIKKINKSVDANPKVSNTGIGQKKSLWEEEFAEKELDGDISIDDLPL